eukprot:457356-Rhodomonas_salina.1
MRTPYAMSVPDFRREIGVWYRELPRLPLAPALPIRYLSTARHTLSQYRTPYASSVPHTTVPRTVTRIRHVSTGHRVAQP